MPLRPEQPPQGPLRALPGLLWAGRSHRTGISRLLQRRALEVQSRQNLLLNAVLALPSYSPSMNSESHALSGKPTGTAVHVVRCASGDGYGRRVNVERRRKPSRSMDTIRLVFDFGTCLIFTRKVDSSNCAKLLAVPFQFQALNSLNWTSRNSKSCVTMHGAVVALVALAGQGEAEGATCACSSSASNSCGWFPNSMYSTRRPKA